LSLAIADLDHFKQVNDLYGHQRGDQYLIQVVAALKSVLVHVPHALLARYGGEEFAALLPDVSEQQSQIVAEQMRRSVQDLAIFHEASPFDKRQTVSVGVATLSQKSGWRDTDQFIGIADRALYEAKRLGRNRVVASFPARNETEAQLVLVH